MKIAIIDSRNLTVDNLEKYLPKDITEIVSGGAKGIDACARKFAINNNIMLKEFLPDYDRYDKTAPLKRNLLIIDYADVVYAFWDGESHGTKFVIDNLKELINRYMYLQNYKNFVDRRGASSLRD